MRADKRDRHVHQVRPFLRPAGQGRAKHLRDRHAHKRRRDIRPVVHVLVEHAVFPIALATDQPHGIDIEQQARRAALGVRLGIEDVRSPKTQFKSLVAIRVLVQQEAQIGRRYMGCRDRVSSMAKLPNLQSGYCWNLTKTGPTPEGRRPPTVRCNTRGIVRGRRRFRSGCSLVRKGP